MERLVFLVCLLTSVVVSAEANERVLGAVLPANARKVAELRYRVTENWENIHKFYNTIYPRKNFPWKNVVNQPGVKAFHIVNPSGKGWEGLNVYEANDEIRVYVVPAEASKKAKRSGKK